MQHFERYKLGVDVKRWREKNNFSQFELAACAGLTPGYISRVENFEMTNPQFEHLSRLCDAIEVNICEYITGGHE